MAENELPRGPRGAVEVLQAPMPSEECMEKAAESLIGMIETLLTVIGPQPTVRLMVLCTARAQDRVEARRRAAH